MKSKLQGIRDGEAVVVAWRMAAHTTGGEFAQVMSSNHPIVQVRGDDGIVTLELAHGQSGFVTRVRAPFHNPLRVSLGVRGAKWLTSFLKAMGFVQDIALGHADFDRRFVVKGFPRARVLELLAPPVADLILAQPSLDLRVERQSLEMHYPAGVSELVLQHATVVRRVDELVGMIRIAQALLSRLDPLGGNADEADADRLIGRLVRSGGTLSNPWTNTLLWDGRPARHDAARQLGARGDPEAVPPLISVLDDPDHTLVVEAIRALATLGDARAIAPLIALLARRGDLVDELSLAEHAGRALTALGQDSLVESVERALAGDTVGLEQSIAPYRAEVIQVLLAVLDSYDIEARVEAATALGVVGAHEAVPLLREKTKAMGLRTRLSGAASAALERIEARASLPRPAVGAPQPPDTLPRAAREGGGAPARDALPRAARREGEP